MNENGPDPRRQRREAPGHIGLTGTITGRPGLLLVADRRWHDGEVDGGTARAVRGG